ncbi:MAG: hypothetical protein ACYCPS_01770 [Candidatus Saccharimonadales bacterium]
MVEEHKDQQTGFQYNPHDGKDIEQGPIGHKESEELTPSSDDEPLFNWSSPDSFSARKDIVWYLVLILVTLIVAAGIYLITKDKITTSVIIVSGILVGIYASKKPRLVNYQVTKYGFTVNGRYHRFGEYRSFSIVHHGEGRSAILTPLKRFMPYMYIYFASDIEQKIESILTDVLPKETSRKDALDKIIRKIGY